MTDKLDDYFNYDNLEFEFSEQEINKNLESIRSQFSKITKNWDEEKNSQWVVRTYLGVKMILSSSVLLSSVEYANTKNLRIVEPYLLYYSLLNCSRAVLYTSPLVEWKQGEIFTMTHSKTINIVSDIVSHFNKQKGKEIGDKIDWAREYREIFSYRFPANGLTDHHLSLDVVVDICKLLCEISQFQSKILENSITKNITKEFDLDWSILGIGSVYGEKNFQFFDTEDGYRLNYIVRKQKRPYSLHSTMTEGMVEDFFGAWHSNSDDKNEDIYDPDANWQIIFPVP